MALRSRAKQVCLSEKVFHVPVGVPGNAIQSEDNIRGTGIRKSKAKSSLFEENIMLHYLRYRRTLIESAEDKLEATGENNMEKYLFNNPL